MENKESEFVSGLISSMCREDPKAVVDILTALLTVPRVKEYATLHESEMDEFVTFTVSRGSLPFLMSACMIALGDMSMNNHAKRAGCMHARMFEKYANVSVVIARLVLDAGYPDATIVSEMETAVRTFHDVSKKTDDILDRVATGEVTMDNLMDSVKKVRNE
jgi:hypothetical protein